MSFSQSVSPRDAFGREIGEDPLAEMGLEDGSRANVAPPPEVEGLDAARGRSSRGRSTLRAAILVAALVPPLLIGGALLLALGTEDKLDRGERPATTPAEDRTSERRAPAATDSMVRRDTLAQALRRLRTRAGGRLRFLRVDAQRVDVQAIDAAGRITVAQARAGEAPRVLSTSDAGGVPQGSTFAWSEVDAGAPARIAWKLRQRDLPLGYAVLIDAAGLRWSVFLSSGRGTYTARPDGRGVRAVSG